MMMVNGLGGQPSSVLLRPKRERTKRSCTECRRRKQRCDKGQPCSNCARRFPQPICEYNGNRRGGRLSVPSYYLSLFRSQLEDNWAGLDDSQRHAGLPLLLASTNFHDTIDGEATQPRPGSLSFSRSELSSKQVGMWTYANCLSLLDDPCFLPMLHDNELLRIYAQAHSRHTSFLDDRPDQPNVYRDNFIPLCIQNPLLADISIYMAACFLTETQQLDRSVTMSAKGRAIRSLNEVLGSEVYSTSDETIVAVAKLLSNDLCYGETQHLQMHLGGLYEMIQIRGGFSALGMNGLIGKMAAVGDFITALMLETPLILEGLGMPVTSELEGQTPDLDSASDSPFLPTSEFHGPEPLSPTLDSKTAALLSDIRFLIDTVLTLPAQPTPWQLHKLNSMLNWVYNRVSAASPQDNAAVKPSRLTSTPERKPSPTKPTVADNYDSPEPEFSNSESKKTTPGPASPPAVENPVHQAVQLAAQIYCRAIRSRQPLSVACRREDATELLERVWRVPLEMWKQQLGVLLWILVVTLPTSRDMPSLFVGKSMVTVVGLQMSLAHWSRMHTALRRAVRLQEWLLGGSSGHNERDSS